MFFCFFFLILEMFILVLEKVYFNFRNQLNFKNSALVAFIARLCKNLYIYRAMMVGFMKLAKMRTSKTCTETVWPKTELL